jgi:sulfate transport system permease protein
VQPVLRDLAVELEEAAASLGAGRIPTIRRVILPQISPAVLAGATLSFARGLGEYGSVIFIAGNIPLRSEITPLLIMIRLEEFDYASATAVALVFLCLSFCMLLVVNRVGHARTRGLGG